MRDPMPRPLPLILRLFTRLRPVLLALAVLAGTPHSTPAHEIPKSITIVAYLKPEGKVLRLVARVPLEAMRDIQWPLRGPGYLVLDKLDEYLRDGVKLWVIDNVKVFEEGAALSTPAIKA